MSYPIDHIRKNRASDIGSSGSEKCNFPVGRCVWVLPPVSILTPGRQNIISCQDLQPQNLQVRGVVSQSRHRHSQHVLDRHFLSFIRQNMLKSSLRK